MDNRQAEIKRIFRLLIEAETPFLVLRRHDFVKNTEKEPPCEIDLLTLSPALKQIKQIMRTAGYAPVYGPGHAGFSKRIGTSFLAFDFQTDSVTERNIPCMTYAEAVGHAETVEGVSLLEGPELVFHLLTHTLLNRKFFDAEDKETILNKMATCRKHALTARLAKCFGRAQAERILYFVKTRQFRKLENKNGKYLWLIILRRPAMIKHLLSYMKWRIRKRLRVGSIISFIGLDGTGKTTMARELVKVLNEHGEHAQYIYMGRQKAHALPLESMARRAGVSKIEAKGKEPSRFYLLARQFAYYSDYLARFVFFILPVILRGRHIVCDRYAYDFCQDNYCGKTYWFLARFLYPKPGLLVFLTVPESTIINRKNEYNSETRKLYLERWHKTAQIFRAKTIVSDNLKQNVEDIYDIVAKTCIAGLPGHRIKHPEQATGYAAKQFSLSALCSPKGAILYYGYDESLFKTSREFDKVYVLDNRTGLPQAVKKRAAKEGIEIIDAILNGSPNMPVSDSFFDVVLLNGNIKEHSLEKTLYEIIRVLKPDGILYLAATNKLHPLATRKRAPSVSTPSLNALLKPINKCGLKKTICFSVYPNPEHPKYIASLNGPGACRFLCNAFSPLFLKLFLPTKGRAGKTAEKIIQNSARLFSPAWIVIASRSRLPKLGLRNNGDLLEISDCENNALAAAITNRNAGIFTVEKSSGDVLKKTAIPVNELAHLKARVSQSVTDYIRQHSATLAACVPASSINETSQGPVITTEAIHGRGVNMKDRSWLKNFCNTVCMMGDMNIRPGDMPEIYAKIDIREKLAGLAEKHGLKAGLIPLLQKSGIIHGDLNCGNIMEKGSEIIILDFEHATIGPPVLNWYDFLLRNLVFHARSYPLKSSIIIKRLENLARKPDYTDYTNEILDSHGAPRDTHTQLIALYTAWLLRDKIVDNPAKVIKAAMRLIENK